ncbi:Leucine-rich repeat-containing protein 58 [Cricetulus griseus]|uniref:Leucine-rich repeat-containing protein 58 n=1 Tax=Cricetulus griseus TaxID=10029 RepID=G3IN96_CRIGR|nr:Leucine-rich repeat-containing protein 58 [Cricetulus griseus]
MCFLSFHSCIGFPTLLDNLLTDRPPEIPNTIHLEELSFQGNPLFASLLSHLTYSPPTGLGLLAKTRRIQKYF